MKALTESVLATERFGNALAPTGFVSSSGVDFLELLLRTIPLTKGYEAIVDDADFDWLNQWKWQACVDRSVDLGQPRMNTVRVCNLSN